METQVAVGVEDVQVAAKPRRRTYTAEYKRRILREADACTTPGLCRDAARQPSELHAQEPRHHDEPEERQEHHVHEQGCGGNEKRA